MTLETKDGKLNIFSGKSRSGKTALCVKLVTNEHKTAFIWDIQGQWSKIRGYKKVADLRELANIAKTGKAGRWCYVPSGDFKAEFNLFCQCSFHYAQHFGACGVVAEELAQVTSAGKASNWWFRLLSQSLKYGACIYAISQRWAEADKTAIGNATDFYVFRSLGADVEYIAEKAGLAVSDVKALKKLDYIHFDVDSEIIEQLKLTF